MTPKEGDAAREVAFAALFSLVNLTFPATDGRPQGDDYLRQLVAYVEAQADRYADWPAASWRVDDTGAPPTDAPATSRGPLSRQPKGEVTTLRTSAFGPCLSGLLPGCWLRRWQLLRDGRRY